MAGVVGAFLLLTPLPGNLSGDSVRYMGLADAIADGRGYEFNFRPHTRFPPGTPILLATVRGVIGGGYPHYLATMAVFAALSLIASYTLLERLGHPRLGLIAMIAVAASPIFYGRGTQDVGSDFPYFFFSLAALAIAVRLESETSARKTLVSSVLLAILVMATVMIRGAGLALLGALCLWILLRFVLRSPRRRQLVAFLPAVAAGLLVQCIWWGWQSRNRIAYWPGEFMNSYFSQLLLANPREPELGIARWADFAGRAAENAVSHAAHVSQLLTNLPWIDARWYSPFVVLPALFVCVGLIRSLRERIGILELYFALYAALYLLWPFDEGVRYTMPVFPLVLLYAWRGVRFLYDRAARDVRRSGARVSLGAAGIFLGGLASALQQPVVGRQAVAALLAWLALCVAAALTARGWVPMPLRRNLDVRAATARAASALFALAIAAGLAQQIPIARRNLRSDPTLVLHRRSVEAAQWLQHRLEPGESAMAGQEAIVHYVTGFRVIPLPVTSDARVLGDTIDRYNVRYLVIYRNERDPYVLPTEKARLAVLQRSQSQRLTLALETETYWIYSIAAMSAEHALEPVGESERERHDRQRRIDMARGGEDGAARQVEIVDVVEPAVGVDHAFAGIRGHARRPDVMVVVRELAIPVGARVEQPVGSADAAEIEAAELERQRPGENGQRASIELGQTPRDPRPPRAQRVARGRERDPAVGIRGLLQRAHQVEPRPIFAAALGAHDAPADVGQHVIQVGDHLLDLTTQLG